MRDLFFKSSLGATMFVFLVESLQTRSTICLHKCCSAEGVPYTLSVDVSRPLTCINHWYIESFSTPYLLGRIRRYCIEKIYVKRSP